MLTPFATSTHMEGIVNLNFSKFIASSYDFYKAKMGMTGVDLECFINGEGVSKPLFSIIFQFSL